MSFQICIKTKKSLQQLATEIRDLLSLPPFKLDSFAEEPYCQFEMFGMLVFLRRAEEEEREPEVMDYQYCFDMQMSFTELELDTDDLEYQLQPYYAQLLAFRLGLETACYEKKKVGQHWQIRCRYFCKNPSWDGTTLYGEEGWLPAVTTASPTPWRSLQPLISHE